MYVQIQHHLIIGLFCREKEKNKQREDNWYKVQNLAMGNPQVCF
jgi:hypothetical protein